MFDDIATYLGNAGTRSQILGFLVDHIYLSLLPVVFAVALAIPIGWSCHRFPTLRGGVLGTANIIYTIPSLALFVIIPAVIGSQILWQGNVIIALTIYTTALLVRPVADALDAVPGHLIAAATAMGYRPLTRFLTVELPLAVPVLAAGLRVGCVSNISLVSVGALIGTGGLGVLFTDGFPRRYLPPIIVGIVLILVLALVVDLLLVALRRRLTPWSRVQEVSVA